MVNACMRVAACGGKEGERGARKGKEREEDQRNGSIRSEMRRERNQNVRPLSPSLRAIRLDGEDRGAIRKNREAVLVGLLTEDLEARQRNDASLGALLLEQLGGLNSDGNLGTGGNEGNVGVLDLVEDVTTLVGLLDRRAGELGEVLAGEGKDGGSVGRGEGHVVGSGGLVAVGRAPDVAVREGAEVCAS